jgi:cytochrome c556
MRRFGGQQAAGRQRPTRPGAPDAGGGTSMPGPIRVRRICHLVIGASVLALGAQASCTPTPRQRYERKLLSTGKPALHAVHTQRLEEVMKQLDQIALDRLPQEVDLGTRQDRHLGEVEALAKALAQTAETIPTSVSQYQFSTEERKVFDNLVGMLYSRAVMLQQRAAAKDLSGVEGSLDEVVATCNACHSAFRQLPPLSP